MTQGLLMSAAADAARLHVWRHPQPIDAAGRCIGSRTDLRVDPRKVKRLAHRIRAHARRHALPHRVATSRLARGMAVGRVLARWGWTHRVDARLDELDFGDWDGMRWDAIGVPAVDAWCRDFAHHRPGGGEPLSGLIARCAAVLEEARAGTFGCACIVGHGGWISAARWIAGHGARTWPDAAQWPAAPGYGRLTVLECGAAAGRATAGMPAR